MSSEMQQEFPPLKLRTPQPASTLSSAESFASLRAPRGFRHKAALPPKLKSDDTPPQVDSSFLALDQVLTTDQIKTLLKLQSSIGVRNVEKIVLSAICKGWELNQTFDQAEILEVDLQKIDKDKKDYLIGLNTGKFGYRRGPEVDYSSLNRSSMVSKFSEIIHALRVMGIDAFGMIAHNGSRDTGWYIYFKP